MPTWSIQRSSRSSGTREVIARKSSLRTQRTPPERYRLGGSAAEPEINLRASQFQLQKIGFPLGSKAVVVETPERIRSHLHPPDQEPEQKRSHADSRHTHRSELAQR